VTPELREAKRRIQEAVKVWKRLEPPGWDITHLFIEGKTDTESPEVLAETDAHWEYHQASIRWSLPNVAGTSEKYLDGTIVHELVHILLSPMESQLRTDQTADDGTPSGIVNGLCEHAVDAVARAILRVAL